MPQACYRFVVGAAGPLRVKSIRFNAPPIVLDQSTTRRGRLPALHDETEAFDESSDILGAMISRAVHWKWLGWIPFIYVESTLRVSVIVLTQSSLDVSDLSWPFRFGWKYIISGFAGSLIFACEASLSHCIAPIAMAITVVAWSYSAVASFDSFRNSVTTTILMACLIRKCTLFSTAGNWHWRYLCCSMIWY